MGAGQQDVFVRNPNYVARSEPPSGLAGSKKTTFDRVEWLYLPDANSAVAALKRGEVDIIEQLPPDYIAPLRTDSSIKIGSGGAYQGFLVMNQLHPPFNNPKVRQALLQAVSQERFVRPWAIRWTCAWPTAPPTSSAAAPTTRPAGAEPYRKADVAKAKQMLADPATRARRWCCWCPATCPTSTPRR
jgi:peptide/nickel transport system substrate-binding protein